MFSTIKSLVESLTEVEVSKYTQVKNARKVLQEIKKEAQKLRNELTEQHKNSKK